MNVKTEKEISNGAEEETDVKRRISTSSEGNFDMAKHAPIRQEGKWQKER